MNGKIYLNTLKSRERKNGFPVMLYLSGKGKRIEVSLKMEFQKDEWNFDKQEPMNNKRATLFIRKKKAQLDELLFMALDDPAMDVYFIKNAILESQTVTKQIASFYEFADLLIAELKKGVDSKGFTKLGNARAYETAIKQLKKYRATVYFSQIDYNLLVGFIRFRKNKGNKNTTIHNYLRTYRAIYNEAVRRNITEDNQPFKNVFSNVIVKKNRTVKKYITKESIYKLEAVKNISTSKQFAVDMWLLQFYFGGQDFKDIYYLENSQINNNRVYFVRGKLDETGYQFDLLIPEKAQKIIDKYNTKDRFVIPGRKDDTGYRNLIRRVQKNLQLVQTELQIEVLPLGGYLAPKVSRHTFATLGRFLLIESDILRALMGHERKEVDTLYKEVYPKEMRDEAHLKIIG